jgi:hypothetical protein
MGEKFEVLATDTLEDQMFIGNARDFRWGDLPAGPEYSILHSLREVS